MSVEVWSNPSPRENLFLLGSLLACRLRKFLGSRQIQLSLKMLLRAKIQKLLMPKSEEPTGNYLKKNIFPITAVTFL